MEAHPLGDFAKQIAWHTDTWNRKRKMGQSPIIEATKRLKSLIPLLVYFLLYLFIYWIKLFIHLGSEAKVVFNIGGEDLGRRLES